MRKGHTVQLQLNGFDFSVILKILPYTTISPEKGQNKQITIGKT